MKRQKPIGRSARRGTATSPYEKYNKRPYTYEGQNRLANGQLKVKANDKLGNKYV